MAGRPAPGGNTGILVGMFVSIGVALIALVLLIVLWTNQEELKKATTTAQADLQRVMTTSEMSGALSAWFNRAQSGKSASRLINDELQAVSNLIADGIQPPNMAADIQSKLQPLWNSLADDKLLENPSDIAQQPLLITLEKLYAAYKSEYEKNQQAQSTIDGLNTQIAQLTGDFQQAREGFDQKSTDLNQQVATINEEWSSFRTEKETQFDQIQEQINVTAEREKQDKMTLQERIAGLNSELDKKEQANKELQEKVREFQILPQPRMAARQGDGHILLTNLPENLVFVDLGKDDHLTLGLRFAVYAPDPGIPGSGEAKASIEVVSVGQEVSHCRVVWQNEMNPVLKGDLVANPIYDRSRRLRFYVMGEYDLNHDGIDDPAGSETIEAVIKDLGGELDQELSSRTDFVILGARPMVQRLPEDASPELIAIHEDQVARADVYEAAVKQALSLSVPIFTQETFLNFMGRAPTKTAAR
ncbi:MAG: hypothetical protein HJJLKODD_02644 [Phycisphaerae bacterium]|nr:hypothetical protein [Phycisphaerae bacterium]